MDKTFNVKANEVNKWRINSRTCAVCRKAGMDGYIPAPPLSKVITFGNQ
jgi:hypothetical protein